MANSVVSVDIGTATTRIVEIDYKRNNPSVYKCFSIPTPEGAIEDGQILDPEGFGEKLKQSLSENGVKTKKAVYSITSSKIANREVIVPKVKPRSLGPLVNAKATEYFPVDMSLYHLAYNKLGEIEEEGRKQLKMLVLAAPKDLLESYYDLSKAAGLSVEALDYAGNSIMPVIKADVGNEVTLVIKIDEQSSVLTVLDEKKVTLQRNITYGGDSAIEEVVSSDPLGTTSYDDALKLLRGQKLIDLSVEEPVEKKRGPGRRKKVEEDEESMGGAAADMDLRRQKLIFNVTQSLDMFVGSVTRVIDYYNSRNTERPITKCLLTGMGGDFVGLDEMLSAEMEIEVGVLDTVSAAKLAKDVKKISIGEYIACIGASIDPMDLIPPEHDRKKAGHAKAASKEGKDGKGGKAAGISLSSDQTAILGWAMLGVGVVATGALLVLSFLPYNQAKQKNVTLTNELNSLMPIVDTYNQYMDTQALYTEVSNIYNMTNTRNDGLRNFVDELEIKLPTQSVIEAFSSDGATANLSFKCASKEEAVNIVNNLRSFDSLAMLSVSQYTEKLNAEDMTSEVVFSVMCTYKPPEIVSINQLGTSSYESYDSFTVDVTDGETVATTEEGEGEEQ